MAQSPRTTPANASRVELFGIPRPDSRDARTLYTRDLHDAVQVLRKVAKRGEFGADAGYDLRKMASWTPAQRAKVTRYAKEFSALLSQPHDIVRPRSQQDLATLKDYAGQHDKNKFRVAVVPKTFTKQTTVVNKKTGEVTQEGEVVDKRTGEVIRVRVQRIKFDRDMILAGDVREAARLALQQAPKGSAIRFQNGLHQMLVHQNGTAEYNFRGMGDDAEAFLDALESLFLAYEDAEGHESYKWFEGLVVTSLADGQKRNATQTAQKLGQAYSATKDIATADKKARRNRHLGRENYKQAYTLVTGNLARYNVPMSVMADRLMELSSKPNLSIAMRAERDALKDMMKKQKP